MGSPFQRGKAADSVIRLWRGEVIDLPRYGVDLCLKRYPHFRGDFSVVSLFTVYDAEVKCELADSSLRELAGEIDLLAKRYGVNSVSLRIGRQDPRGRATAPGGYHWQYQGDLGFVDLGVGFDNYLNARKSGYAEYYKRGVRRDLYEVETHSTETSRSYFDGFLGRMRETYRCRGYSYKTSPSREDELFASLREGRALLYSVRAKENPEASADVYLYLTEDEAYYYLAARSTPVKGVLQGVAHFAQISLVKELMNRGLKRYTLGFVSHLPNLPRSEAGVREFKRGLSTATEPLVTLTKESFSVWAFNRYVYLRKSFRNRAKLTTRPRL